MEHAFVEYGTKSEIHMVLQVRSLRNSLCELVFLLTFTVHSDLEMVPFQFPLQGMLLGLLLFPSFYKSVLYIRCLLTSSNKSGAQLGRGWAYVGISRSMLFYFSLLAMLILIVPAWMMFAEDFHIHPLQWYASFEFVLIVARFIFHLISLFF